MYLSGEIVRVFNIIISIYTIGKITKGLILLAQSVVILQQKKKIENA